MLWQKHPSWNTGGLTVQKWEALTVDLLVVPILSDGAWKSAAVAVLQS